MRRLVPILFLFLTMGLVTPGASQAQDPTGFLAVGETAPDIQVTGATRYGVIEGGVDLSDYRGETVVLAFFFRARTGG
jgi:peroxiredoxin Q/BCP